MDTDPGGDDIFALLWLLSLVKQGVAKLVAVTTAEGNVSARQTFAAASKILKLGGLDEIEIGRAVAVNHATTNAAHIHGSDGMGNLSQTLPEGDRSFELANDSDQVLIDALTTQPGEITILAIAPFTNLAAAETRSPGILQRAKEIVLMGGAFGCAGNVTAHAEFNVAYHPEAAQVVLNSRSDIVMVPLDVTRSLIFTEAMAQTIRQANPDSAIAQFIDALCSFMISTALTYRETQGDRGFLIHDAATVGYLFYPETFLWRRATVQIETQGLWTRGQTLIDNRHGAKAEANAWIATQVDAPNFFTSLIEDFKRL
ncbi:nucleoside hydrolase [Leptolyngbya sp. Cla-17]|uniref:nucleoside hydrolase n=1 Tax=Leptolyngbya sp. Cla-17 TaxID=2803751 RepID=UPI0018D7ED00|nr:nucleoside hydrolase [Leptolyngbya sp. Cla-17]